MAGRFRAQTLSIINMRPLLLLLLISSFTSTTFGFPTTDRAVLNSNSVSDSNSLSFNPDWTPNDIDIDYNQPLGSGGFGNVVRGMSKQTPHIKVAVKFFKKKPPSRTGYDTIKAFKHPNIMKTTKLFLDPFKALGVKLEAIAISEYCDGGDLAKYLEEYKSTGFKAAKR